MRRAGRWYFGAAAIALAAAMSAPATRSSAQQGSAQNNGAVSIGDSDLGGVVTSQNGPEAGVWVIAETTDLPTKYVKIVVTDDQGRYVLPDLPKASYTVWVRGYGLVDSPKQTAAPGKLLNLTAMVAHSARTESNTSRTRLARRDAQGSEGRAMKTAVESVEVSST